MARNTMTTETTIVDGVRVLRLARPPVNASDLRLIGDLAGYRKRLDELESGGAS